MKRKFIVLLIFIILFLIVGVTISRTYDKTYKNLNLVVYKKNDKLRKNINVLVTGKLRFYSFEVYDKEYKIKFPFPFIKRIKNVANAEGWYDEEPVYIMNKGNIQGLHFSEEAIKNMCNTIVKHNVNFKIEDKNIEPYFYSDSDYPFFAKVDNEGFWRIRYYSGDIDKEKEYTYIGKWTGKELVPIKGIEKDLFEGKYSKWELENQDNTFKILLTCICVAVSIVLTIVLIIIFFTDFKKKKTKAL